MMEPALLNYGALGIMLVAMLKLVHWGKGKMEKMESAAAARHEACEARNRVLETRLQSVEDRQFTELKDLTERGLLGLAASTAAIKRVMRDNSETPAQELPAMHRPARYPTPRPGL